MKGEESSQNTMEQMLLEQLALGENIASTSQFLRFALELSSNNLVAIREKLLTIKALCEAMEADEACGEGTEAS